MNYINKIPTMKETDRDIQRWEDKEFYSAPVIVPKNNEYHWNNWIEAMEHMKFLKKIIESK